MSQNFHYFHPSDNVASGKTVTSGVAADASYPLANVVDLAFKNLANPGGIGAAVGDVIVDFGGAQDVKAILLWTNFVAALAYRVQTYVTNVGTLAIDQLKAAPAKRADGHTVKIYHDLSVMPGYSAGTRYLRINVTGTNDVNLRLKLLAFSTIRQTDRNIDWGLSLDEHQTHIDMDTEAHQPWPYDLSAPPRLISADLSVGTDADADRMREWQRACGGGSKVTLLVPDPTTPDPFLGRFKDSVSIQSPAVVVHTLGTVLDFINVNRQRLTLKEIVSGDPEWT